MEIIKRFLEWISVKEKLHKNIAKPPLFKEGEIWWCYCGENIGIEINGKGDKFTRPMLVIKKYDKYSFLGLPLTTKMKIGTWYSQILFDNKTQTVCLAQSRVFDYRRFKEKIGQLEDIELEKVHKAYTALHTFSVHRPSNIATGSRGKSQI